MKIFYFMKSATKRFIVVFFLLWPAYSSGERQQTAQKINSIPSLTLFQWANEQEISLQWAYGFLENPDVHAPALLQKTINSSFKNDTFIYLNFHQNFIQFPYIFKWGIRGSAGLTRNYDHQSDYFIPVSVSAVLSLWIFKTQHLTPFVEMGVSGWSVNLSETSDVFPFYGGGVALSLALFKPSLRYTMPEEYGIRDIGFIIEVRNHLSPFDHPEEKTGAFMLSLHAGLYFRF